MKLRFYAIILMVLFSSCSSDDENNCVSPSNLIADADENFVFFSWDSPNGVTSISYGSKGFIPTGSVNRISFDGWSALYGLQPNTEYDIYLENNCNDGITSDLAGPFLFQTLNFGQGCTQPQSLIVAKVTSTTVTISWNGMEQGLWEVAYGTNLIVPSDDDWNQTNEPTFELEAIEPGIAYYIYVRATCGTLEFSNSATLLDVILIE